MPELFKLIDEEFSKVDQEYQWTYSLLSNFTFKKWTIKKITITDHYQINHKEAMDNKLILNIFQNKVNGLKRLKPLPDSYYLWKRDVFRFETVYQNKKYRCFFWLKDNADNHLWVRNCHPVD